MGVFNRDPEHDVVAKALLRALLEIHIYQSGHAVNELKPENIEELTAANLFSTQTKAFIKNHQARFYGFPHRIGSDIVVLDIVLPGKRFIGFSDGHVKCEVHENRTTTCAQDTI